MSYNHQIFILTTMSWIGSIESITRHILIYLNQSLTLINYKCNHSSYISDLDHLIELLYQIQISR